MSDDVNECACGTDGCASECEGNERAKMPPEFIANPLIKEELPMVMLFVEGKIYVGGTLFQDGMDFLICEPLMLLTQMSKNAEGAIVTKSEFMPFPMGLISDMGVSCSSYYYLRKARRQDQEMVTQYEQGHKNYSLSESGLVAPTIEDIQRASGLVTK